MKRYSGIQMQPSEKTLFGFKSLGIVLFCQDLELVDDPPLLSQHFFRKTVLHNQEFTEYFRGQQI